MIENRFLPVAGILLLSLGLTPSPARAGVVGDGTVVDVNWPGRGKVGDFEVANGDAVSGGHAEYTPGEDTRWVKGGERYNLTLVTKPASGAQLFIVFWGTGHEHPPLETTLESISAMVRGSGAGDRPIREGDTVKISTQTAENYGVDVTLDVYREREPVATFSFVREP